MALERHLIDIPFAAGLGQKDDPKQLAPPKLLDLENGDFTTLKQIRKRPQLRSLGTLSTAKGKLGAEYRNELLVADGENLYSLAESQFVNKGYLPFVSATSEPGPRTPALAADSAVSGNWRMTVWKPAAGQALQYAVQHTVTKQTLYSGSTGSSTSAIAPKLVVFNGYFVLFYIEESVLGGLNYGRLMVRKSTIPTTTSAPVWSEALSYVTANLRPGSEWSSDEGGYFYDVCVQGTRVYIVTYEYDAGDLTHLVGEIHYRTISSTFASVGSVADSWTPSVLEEDISGVCVIPDWDRATAGNAGVIVIWGRTDQLVAVPVLWDRTAWTAGLTSAVAGARFITAVVEDSPNSLLVVYATEVTGGVSEKTVQLGWTTFRGFSESSGPSITSGSVCYRARPCAKAFTYTDALGATAIAVPLMHDSAMTPTMFVMRFRPDAYWMQFTTQWVARLLPNVAGGWHENLAGVTTKWLPPYNQLAETTSKTWVSLRRTDSDQTGIDLLTFDVGAEASAVKYGDNLLIASGGLLYMYDGHSVVEHGFLMPPSVEEYPFGGSSGGGSHSYSYTAVYAWTDARGQVHRSSPTVAPVATDGSPSWLTKLTADPINATHPVFVKIPSLNETAKTGVTIELYRTTDGQSVYYLCATADNDSSGAPVSFTDAMPDDNDSSGNFLLEQRQLYTTGGVVQNDPAPVSKIVCEHGKRVWVVDEQESGVLTYSRTLIPSQSGASGVPAEFSDYFQIRVNSTGDEITGIGSMDEKLVVFMRDKMGFVTGDGPDDTGGNGAFSFYPLPHKNGAIKHGSIVSTSKGLLFQSDQGFMLLDRSLQLQPVGLDVETYAKAADIVSGLALTTSTQVHMLDATNKRVLAFDTLTEQWSMWPLTVAPACIFQYGTKVEILRADGALLEETAWSPTATYGDLGTWISEKVGTGWIKLNGIAGYERLRRIWLTGEFESAHVLHWALYLDYSATVVQSGTFTADAATARGGYQIRIDVVSQKCEAFRIVVYDTAPVSGVIGEGMRLSGLTLELGVKKSGAKLATPQITG